MSATPATPATPALPAPPRNGGALFSAASTRSLIDLAATARRLRDEQIRAKIVYYGEGQQTNAELDAITDAVVAELQSLQRAGATVPAEASETAKADASIELTATLRGLLEKLFSPRREGFMRRKIEDIQRKISGLFFSSALFVRLQGAASEAPTVRFSEQAVYLAFREGRASMVAALRAQRHEDPSVLRGALARVDAIERELRMAYLSRTTPELEALLKIYREALLAFFFEELSPSLGDFCWSVVRESRVGIGRPLGYKLQTDAFAAFREVFERHFIERLVLHVQRPIAERAAAMRETFREETLLFVADPRIFSEVSAVICNAVYDYLYSEGFLDLPTQWRNHLFNDGSA